MSTEHTLYLVDTSTGTGKPVGEYTSTSGMLDIASTPDGKMYGVAEGGTVFVSIDPWTAATKIVGRTGATLNALTVTA